MVERIVSIISLCIYIVLLLILFITTPVVIFILGIIDKIIENVNQDSAKNI